jgi:curved DNA-binding protein CbpA
MVSDGRARNHHENLPWPEVTTLNRIPTPYQIFGQKKGSKYSKQRFYELVKLYHPDRHSHNDVGISFATKLERYRLVVAANDILSDPVKRGAYDTYGAGWNGMPDVLAPRDAAEGNQKWGNYSGRGWGGGPGGPSQNATWEDWERWYQQQNGTEGKQSPLWFSNGAFMSLIVIFAALGGIGQATRVGNYSVSFLEQRDALHDQISKDLMRRKKESVKCTNHEIRVQNFLMKRDPYGYGIADPQEDAYRKLLPDPEICSSEDIKERPMEVYHEKNKRNEK